MANLSSRRALKAATTAIRIAARLEHPMKQALEDAETYDWYATKPNYSLSEPYTLVVPRQQSPWMTNAGHQIITTLRVFPKEAGTEIIRAEIWQVIEDEGISDYESIYTDGSLKEEQVGCAMVLSTATPNNDLQ
jgi:hypothetical protein